MTSELVRVLLCPPWLNTIVENDGEFTMIAFCLFGAGRIGSVHADNINANPRTTLKYVVDIDAAAAFRLAEKYGAATADVATALADSSIDAVLIASATATHADLIKASVRADKAIFCEKPLDLDLCRAEECVDLVQRSKLPFALGFNRRFDRNFQTIHEAITTGQIGEVETVIIISRDPAPPPVEYIIQSGGIYRDMMIHDFDMARWLLGEDPIEVYANGSCLIDSAIEVAGDVDTAAVVLKTETGKFCQITNSRRSVYGYDQRIEVFGSNGMLRTGNELNNLVTHHGCDGVMRAKPVEFFIERYADAYRRELEDFVDAILNNRAPLVTVRDGYQALLLANAAAKSDRSGKAIRP